MSAILLLLAAAASPAATPDQLLAAIYAPYRKAGAEPPADWDRPVFTRAASAAIARWKRQRPAGGLDASGLDEAGWFCACQDWDSAAFTVSRPETAMQGNDRALVRVAVRAAADGPPVRLAYRLQREAGAWLIADLSSPAFPKGLLARLQAPRHR